VASPLSPDGSARRLPRFVVPTRGSGALGRWPRLLAALGAGLVLALSFPPYGLWPLAFPAIAALSLAANGVRAATGAVVGMVFGLGFFAILLSWMQVIGTDAWVALTLVESAFMAALGAGLAVTSRLRWWPLAHAALWVGVELLRARLPFGGFPWGRLAFGQAHTPLTPFAAIGGAPLVTFLTALAGTLLAYAVATAYTARQEKLLSAGVAVAGVSAIVALGFAVPIPTSGDRSVTVALVQGNVPRLGLDFQGQRMAVVRNHVATTLDLARRVDSGELPRPDLVIWPENATDIDPFRDPQVRSLIDDAVRAVGVPTLVGAVVDSGPQGRPQNTGIVWDPVTGPGQIYIKRHLVPFGEYVPLRSLLENGISRFDRIPRDFSPGDRAGVLTVGPARLGDVICFEVAYDDVVRDTVKHGAQAIVVETNNATYGHTGQTEQQLAISRLRAVEHGRSMLIAATSGISALISPDGSIVQRSKEFTRDLIVAPAPLRRGYTVADRVGDAPEWVLAGIGLVALALAIAGGRRKAAPTAPDSFGQPVAQVHERTTSEAS
jgi:apolipoprotein N-acyltransferase